jgi:hypothetical protein
MEQCFLSAIKIHDHFSYITNDQKENVLKYIPGTDDSINSTVIKLQEEAGKLIPDRMHYQSILIFTFLYRRWVEK